MVPCEICGECDYCCHCQPDEDEDEDDEDDESTLMTQPEPLIAKCDLNKFVACRSCNAQEERIDRLEDQLAALIQAAQFLLLLADGEPLTDFEIARIRAEVESAEDMLGGPEA
jgi:hypothetical protein